MFFFFFLVGGKRMWTFWTGSSFESKTADFSISKLTFRSEWAPCFYLNSRTTGLYQSLFFITHVRGCELWHYKGAADTHQGGKKVKRSFSTKNPHSDRFWTNRGNSDPQLTSAGIITKETCKPTSAVQWVTMVYMAGLEEESHCSSKRTPLLLCSLLNITRKRQKAVNETKIEFFIFLTFFLV